MHEDRREGSTATGALVDAMQAAGAQPPSPPATVRMRAGDRAVFDSIVALRPAREWTQPELLLAVNLARAFADIERVSGEIEIEGDTVANARGTPTLNPKHTLLETLTRRSVALMRTLHIHAQALVGRPDEAAPKRAAALAAARVVSDAKAGDEDDLLA